MGRASDCSAQSAMLMMAIPAAPRNRGTPLRVSSSASLETYMQFIDSIYTRNMTDQQRAWFHAEYERVRKDEVICVLFAIFLGCFGAHHFYLRRNGLGIVYLLLCWTGISAILGMIDAFFSPGRVRRYNAEQAFHISSSILGSAPPPPAARCCPACNSSIGPDAAFCPRCGAATQDLRSQPAF